MWDPKFWFSLFILRIKTQGQWSGLQRKLIDINIHIPKMFRNLIGWINTYGQEQHGNS